MTTGFTYVEHDQRGKLLAEFGEWLDLANYLIGIVERDWKDKDVFAHFDADQDCVHLMRAVGSAKIARRGQCAWFQNQAGVELENLEVQRETYFKGQKFIGWSTSERIRLNFEDELHWLLEEFVEDSESLFAAQIASMQLEDIASGINPLED